MYENIYPFPEGRSPVVRSSKNRVYELGEFEKISETSEFRYARDFLTLDDKAIKNKEKNSIYLDDDYLPNKISLFYKNILRHRSQHFMIGDSSNGEERFKFMYDTIHEAAESLKSTKKELFNDYESCIKFIARDVCSADAFYQAILGCSILTNEDADGNILDENDVPVESSDSTGKAGPKKFKCFKTKYDHTRIFDEYHGITTDLYNSGKEYIELRKKENGDGHMTKPGQFSSIREHLPITALIKERRDAVDIYLKDANKRVSGVQNANR